MKEKIKRLVESIESTNKLAKEIEDDKYWINKCKEEFPDFNPTDPWIHYDVKLWHIEISVYPDHSSSGMGKHWINGQWFNTSFPKEYPSLWKMLKK